MLELFDKSTRQRIAILQNAIGVREEQKINAISYLYFSLPYSDPKNEICTTFSLVQYNGGDLYRILPKSVTRDDIGVIEYTCEHVIATLLDNVLFGFHVIGGAGYETAQVIRYILGHQLTENWVLGECDFSSQFEYSFEQENLLGALFSLPKPFTTAYQWKFDTSRYPWVLSLKVLDKEALPGLYIRNGHNLTSITNESDPTEICTRLYPLGYGEGVNQLKISDVNGGLPYLQSPPEIVEKYGIVERVWVDRRYENAESLKAAAQAMLDELQEPAESYSVSFANLTKAESNTAKLGEVVRIIDGELGIDKATVITGITIDHDDFERSELTIENRPRDVASMVADLADRQRIEQTYSQGATNLYAQSLQANADAQNGAEINFYIPAEMRIVNKVKAKIKLSRFRAYSKATSFGGSSEQTSSTGGSVSATSASGGGSSETSESAGGFSVTSGSSSRTSTDGSSMGAQHPVDVGPPTPTALYLYAEHTHEYMEYVPTHVHGINHTHTVKAPSHTHDFEIPSHRHSFSLPSHKHNVTIPSHTHNIEPGIYFFGGASGFAVSVNGEVKATYDGSGTEIDLTDLLLGKDGKISRGTWHSVSVIPNAKAYVSIDIFVQGFVQSRGDMTV